MRILFCQTNTYRLLLPLPIGPAMVADRLRADGHEIRFVDQMGEADPVAAVSQAAREFQPDLACFSIRNRDNMSPANYQDPMPGIQAQVAALRSVSPVPVLLGGTAFTTYPQRLMALLGAEWGLAGDNLDNIARFVASVADGQPDLATPGLVYGGADGQVVENPFTITGYRGAGTGHHAFVEAARYRKGYWQAAVITRTGCPERCLYCDTFHTFGREFILREPADIAEELLALKRAGTRSVFLVDAGFNRPLAHAKETLAEIIRRGAQLGLNAIFDPGEADDEFCDLLRRAGCVMVTVFAESLSDPVLETLEKPFRAAEVLRDVGALRRRGIGTFFMPTFGSPGETPATVAETLSRLPALRPTMMDFSIGWRIQPRTPLRERAVREGLIGADDDCWDATFYVSPDTPRTWLEPELRRWRRRHPFRWWPMVPFMLGLASFRPWTLGPDSVG